MVIVCSICGKECEVPFKLNPRACEHCYRGKSAAPGKREAVPTRPDLSGLSEADLCMLHDVLALVVKYRAHS